MMPVTPLLALLVIEGIGAAVFMLVVRDGTRWGLPARAGLSFGLGLVVLPIFLFLASLCGIRPAPWCGIVLLLLLWAGVAAFRRARLKSRRPSHGTDRAARTFRGRVRVLEAALIVFVAAHVAVVGTVSVLEPVVDWDVTAIWVLKAKVLLHDAVGRASYFHDVSRAYSHLDYPLLWPFAIGWTASWTGGLDMEGVKWLTPALLAALAATLYGFTRRAAPRPAALLFTALLLSLPMVLSQASRLLADLPLGFFTLTVFACLHRFVEERQADDAALAGFFAAGALFTKNEGIVPAGAAALASIVILAGGRRPRDLRVLVPRLILAPAMLTAAWFVFRAGIPKVHEDYGGRLNPTVFFGNLSRVPKILDGSFPYWLDTSNWLLFWPVLAVVVLATVRSWGRRGASGFVVLSAALVLSSYGAVYVVSPWPVEALMPISFNRLLLQLAPACVFLIWVLMRDAGWIAPEPRGGPHAPAATPALDAPSQDIRALPLTRKAIHE